MVTAVRFGLTDSSCSDLLLPNAFSSAFRSARHQRRNTSFLVSRLMLCVSPQSPQKQFLQSTKCQYKIIMSPFLQNKNRKGEGLIGGKLSTRMDGKSHLNIQMQFSCICSCISQMLISPKGFLLSSKTDFFYNVWLFIVHPLHIRECTWNSSSVVGLNSYQYIFPTTESQFRCLLNEEV